VQVRELAKNLYWYDYLDADEMDKIFKGEELNKEKVREWKESNNGEGGQPLILFNPSKSS